MKNEIIKTIVAAAIVILPLILHFNIVYSNRKAIYKFEYNGLLWYWLDCHSIAKYKSSDKPINIVSFAKTYRFCNKEK